MSSIPPTTTGAPALDSHDSVSAVPCRPLLSQDEKLAHRGYERIVARGPHTEDPGAYGSGTAAPGSAAPGLGRYNTAQAYGDVGKRTELLTRFGSACPAGGEDLEARLRSIRTAPASAPSTAADVARVAG